MNRQAIPPNKIAIPDLKALSDNARRQSQETELQLRVMAVQSAAAIAKPGEDLKVTMERVKAIGGFLYTGLIPNEEVAK